MREEREKGIKQNFGSFKQIVFLEYTMKHGYRSILVGSVMFIRFIYYFS